MDQEEVLLWHREFYGQYHQHKEQMAYAAGALYVGGAAALIYLESSSVSHLALKMVFAAAVFVAAIAFVAWQLRQRQLAADVVEACERLLARGASGGTSRALDPRVYHGLHMPHFLVDEMVVVAESRRLFVGAPLSAIITYATMVATGVLALLRLVT